MNIAGLFLTEIKFLGCCMKIVHKFFYNLVGYTVDPHEGNINRKNIFEDLRINFLERI